MASGNSRDCTFFFYVDVKVFLLYIYPLRIEVKFLKSNVHSSNLIILYPAGLSLGTSASMHQNSESVDELYM